MRHDLTQVSEEVLRDYLKSCQPDALAWVPATDIRTGIENTETEADEGQESSIKNYPMILCLCESQTPVLPFRGNWTTHCEVRVESVARDTTAATQRERAGEVFDLLLTYSNAGDFAALHAGLFIAKVVPGDVSHRVESGHWVSTLPLNFISAYVD